MKKTLLFAFALTILAFSSCTTKKGFVTKLPKQEIADVQRFPSLSDIDILDKHSNSSFCDSLSLLTRTNIDLFLENQSNIDITGVIDIEDTTILLKVNDEIRQIMGRAFDNKDIAFIPIPPTIDSILDAQGKRFGLITYSTGFERSATDWGALMKSVAVSLAASMAYSMASGGYYYLFLDDSYTNAFSFIGLMIVDAQNNNIAFYNNSRLEEKPSRKYCTDRHFMELYYRYWR